MKKMNNTETIQGRIFNHTLSVKQVKNKESANFGQDFINGTINFLSTLSFVKFSYL